MESDQISIHASRSSFQRTQPLHGRTGGPTRRSSKGQWTTEEDEILRMAVQRHKGKNWKRIAQCFKDRTDVQCLHRWQKVINPELVKGPWSKKEDEIITEMVNKYGPKKWSTIAQHLPGRIGKQCRERWHNHLNPNINKEAWTQEEELLLIRAHQMYGNKWAELTRFLPGRTDNAIKNHWNSSVKKKVNMYFASGLLSQFPGMPPPVSYPNHSGASSSSQVNQFSEGDNIVKGGGSQVEEASLPGESPTIAVEDCCKSETSSNLFPEDYCPAFHNATFAMSDVPHGQGDKFLEGNSSLGWGTFQGKEWQPNPDMLADISLPDPGQEASGMFWSSFVGQESHQSIPIPQESSIAALVSVGADNVNLITGADGRVLYLLANPDEYCPLENVAPDRMDYQSSSTFEIPEDGTYDAPCCSMPSEMLGDSFTEPISGTGQITQPDGLLIFTPNPPNMQSKGADLEPVPQCINEDLVISAADVEPVPQCVNDNVVISKGSVSDCSPCEDFYSIEVKDLPKLVPANDFVSAPMKDPPTCSSKEKDFEIEPPKKSEPVSLLNGRPRFPSLDVPAFSSDWQEDYSPLGIRKLMISAIAPFKPWDSPSRVSSPGGALKTAKTFTGSILRKRHRDLVSPLPTRGEKKVEVGPEEDFFTNLSNEFSRLEVMFEECVDKREGPLQSSSLNKKNAQASSSMEKENVNPACGWTDKQGDETMIISESKISPMEATAIETNGVGNGAYETVKEFSGILVEHDMNDMLFVSPGRFGGTKSDQAVNLSAKAFGKRQGALLSSSESCLSVVCSPRLSTKKDSTNMFITTAFLPSASNVENPGKSVPTENKCNSIFMETPVKRSIESPSTWKSPWFINTFAVDTDITIEDIGYFLSPGDQTYDATGIMKQLGGHTVERFINAQEVSGGKSQHSVKQENNAKPSFQWTQHQAASTLMRERRTLDFSECGTSTTPEKGNGKKSFSGPTSFGLKGCR